MQLMSEVPENGPQMYEVAETTAGPFAHLIRPNSTRRGSRRQDATHSSAGLSPPVEPALVDFSHGLPCTLPALKLDRDVAHEVIAHIHLFSLSVPNLQLPETLNESP